MLRIYERIFPLCITTDGCKKYNQYFCFRLLNKYPGVFKYLVRFIKMLTECQVPFCELIITHYFQHFLSSPTLFPAPESSILMPWIAKLHCWSRVSCWDCGSANLTCFSGEASLNNLWTLWVSPSSQFQEGRFHEHWGIVCVQLYHLTAHLFLLVSLGDAVSRSQAEKETAAPARKEPGET